MTDFYTLEQFAKKTGVCPVTASRSLLSNQGPQYVKVGRRYLIPVAAYEKWAQLDAKDIAI